MNAEFNWWLLIVGLVVGAGLVWLVIADWSRREQDVSDEERGAESAWIARAMHERGEHLDPDSAHEILALHREYLRHTGALDGADEPSPTGDSSWADEWIDTSGTGDEATWPTDADWAAEPAGPAERAATGSDLGGWDVRRTPAQHRSVRSGPLSPRGDSAAGTGSASTAPAAGTGPAAAGPAAGTGPAAAGPAAGTGPAAAGPAAAKPRPKPPRA